MKFFNKINVKYLFFIWISFLFILITFNPIVLQKTTLSFDKLIWIARSKYDYYFITNAKINHNDYQYIEIFSFNQVNEKEIFNCTVIMQLENSKYDSNTFSSYTRKLKKNEIVISKKLALKYDIKIGDLLTAKHQVTNEKIQYRIKDIMRSVGNIYNNSEFEMILIGYDDLIANNIKNRIIIFENNDINDLPMQFTMGIEENSLIYRSDQITDLLHFWLLLFFLVIILNVFITVLFIIIFYKIGLKNYYQNKILSGMSKQKHFKEIFLDCLVIVFPPSILLFLFNIIFLSEARFIINFSFSILYFFIQIIAATLISKIICHKSRR